MNLFPLPIFPEGSLASSIVTTVWVGVLVFSFMNLRFGWVYSGLVVPGYIVPLLIVKPWAAGVIVFEAVITLWTVQGIAHLLSRTGIACQFFGRDRFLALLMVSSFYRILGDVWVLPFVGEQITTQFGLAFDYQNNLQSFGLIVICLAANQFWKTGVRKGVFPFAFNIAVTFLIVRFGLMELTNFSITNLSYLYEDIATSVYASPKAYIILITSAIVASRMNLIYGWDFNGILIPALIALQWYEPVKILTSFVEAIFILIIVVQVLKWPAFQSATVEGSRKFLLFFTVSFVYKMMIGWAMFFLDPSAKVSDYYGFGYLLPTLMAIKMFQHERVWHQVRITGQVSLVSVLIANAIGFSLTLLPSNGRAFSDPAPVGDFPGSQQYEVTKFRSEAYRSYIDLHRSILEPELTYIPSPGDTIQFERGLEELLQSDSLELSTQKKFAGVGFRVDRFGDRYFRVCPINPATGRPLILINRKAKGSLTVCCRDALSERHLFEVALKAFQDQSAELLLIGGNLGDEVRDWNAPIHRLAGENGILEVCLSNPEGGSRLYIKRSIPEFLELKKLEARLGEVEALWEDSDRENLYRDLAKDHYCELHVGRKVNAPPIELVDSDEPIDSVIRKLCYEFGPRGSGLYKAPTEAELLHIDRHILKPLFEVTRQNLGTELPAINLAALYYGYRVTVHRKGNETYAILREPDQRKYWGSVIVRIADSKQLCFQVPSRVRDRSLLSFAATQFRRFEARALIVAGTNTLTNPDATSKLTVASNRSNLFNLAHQVFCRSSLDFPTVIQCRAYLPPVGEVYPVGDIIVAPYFGNFPLDVINESLTPIWKQMYREGVRVTSLDYDDATSRYAPGFNVQARYMDFTNRGTFALFWLSPFFRENYELQEENQPVLKMLKAVNIPVRVIPLDQWIDDYTFGVGGQSPQLNEEIKRFRETQDVEVLQSLAGGGKIVAILDPGSSQLFLAMIDPGGQITLIANLARNAPERVVEAGSTMVEAFIDSRAAWMEKMGTPKER